MANHPIQPTTVDVLYSVVTGSNSKKLTLTMPYGSTAQKVMEAAVNVDENLKFNLTFYDLEVGYFVTAIGYTWATPGKNWLLYVGRGGNLHLSPCGVSHWIPPPNSTVELRFEDTPEDHPLHGFKECKEGELAQDETHAAT